MTTQIDLLDRRIALLTCALERAGWTPVHVDIDATSLGVYCVLRRLSDGLRVTLHGTERRATLTTEYRVVTRETHYGLPCDRTRYELLGRRQYSGVRSAARGLRNYLIDNTEGDMSLLDSGVRALLNPRAMQ